MAGNNESKNNVGKLVETKPDLNLEGASAPPAKIVIDPLSQMKAISELKDKTAAQQAATFLMKRVGVDSLNACFSDKKSIVSTLKIFSNFYNTLQDEKDKKIIFGFIESELRKIGLSNTMSHVEKHAAYLVCGSVLTHSPNLAMKHVGIAFLNDMTIFKDLVDKRKRGVSSFDELPVNLMDLLNKIEIRLIKIYRENRQYLTPKDAEMLRHVHQTVLEECINHLKKSALISDDEMQILMQKRLALAKNDAVTAVYDMAHKFGNNNKFGRAISLYAKVIAMTSDVESINKLGLTQKSIELMREKAFGFIKKVANDKSHPYRELAAWILSSPDVFRRHGSQTALALSDNGVSVDAYLIRAMSDNKKIKQQYLDSVAKAMEFSPLEKSLWVEKIQSQSGALQEERRKSSQAMKLNPADEKLIEAKPNFEMGEVVVPIDMEPEGVPATAHDSHVNKPQFEVKQNEVENKEKGKSLLAIYSSASKFESNEKFGRAISLYAKIIALTSDSRCSVQLGIDKNELDKMRDQALKFIAKVASNNKHQYHKLAEWIMTSPSLMKSYGDDTALALQNSGIDVDAFIIHAMGNNKIIKAQYLDSIAKALQISDKFLGKQEKTEWINRVTAQSKQVAVKPKTKQETSQGMTSDLSDWEAVTVSKENDKSLGKLIASAPDAQHEGASAPMASAIIATEPAQPNKAVVVPEETKQMEISDDELAGQLIATPPSPQSQKASAPSAPNVERVLEQKEGHRDDIVIIPVITEPAKESPKKQSPKSSVSVSKQDSLFKQVKSNEKELNLPSVPVKKPVSLPSAPNKALNVKEDDLENKADHENKAGKAPKRNILNG